MRRRHLKIHDGMFGLCVGNALGLPGRRLSRDKLSESPITSMTGGGPLGQLAGTWSYDASFAICLLASMASPLDGVNYQDVMDRFWQCCRGRRYLAFNSLFDVDDTIRSAIYKKPSGGNPIFYGGTDELDATSGCLARCFPLVWHLQSQYGFDFNNVPEAHSTILNLCSLTHRHPRCFIATGIYLSIAFRLLSDMPLSIAVPYGIHEAADYYASRGGVFQRELPLFERIINGKLIGLPEYEINTSYQVVDTLEAALWALVNTESYADCVLRAVNLGVNGDTLGAVAGSLAGLYYGLESIPPSWLSALVCSDRIDNLCAHYLCHEIKSCTDRLTRFLPFLEKATAESVCTLREDMNVEFPAIIYCDELLHFVEAFNRSSMGNYNYKQITQEYRDYLTPERIIATIAAGDFNLVTAILTATIRTERFQPGVWINAIEKKIFHRCILRLQELAVPEEDDQVWHL